MFADMNFMHMAIAFGGGLLVGWNFLAQPQFVKDIMDKILGIFNNK